MTLNASVARLAIAQALSGANSTVVYATGAIIGNMLSPRPELATLPISLFVVGMALSTLPVGMLARRFGRPAAFLAGNVCGVLVGLLAALALVNRSFALFCFAMLFGGAYAAVVLTFRFAAAECVGPEERPRALSLVLAGGVAAGVVGPQLVSATMNLWPPHAYAVTYLTSAAVAVLAALVLRGVRFQVRTSGPRTDSGRPVREILRQPQLLVAMLCGVVSYMMMNFMMTSAPLAMELCGIPRLYSNYGIEMHVIAMYAPSFFTGRLIARFGAPAIVLAGLALTGMAALAGLSGMTVHHFWIALVLLGVGWNFGFLGASAMVLTCHRPEEGPRVQSLNDFVVFGAMVVGSFVSGSLLAAFGWAMVSSLILPPVVIAAAALLWLQRTSVEPSTQH
ncbi:putative permease of the Major Facilitator Superfamily (MFS) family [Cupriavidus taiwanensis]|uniref:MFS transporter n=1 Tax=Cupriavidus taiwanensis TaxID=164546 RepID=UPI000E178244|nr:MFS transporter [Cupriavidus taiwanensis]SOZ19131.1 putative permease of the Major Facilitator Superfamily (MFS) family [Cupriavidus taiwanensis]SOZ32351.1 putative permease of the Major Facilitator Superfamily (MFS) family [Cupriavidus taiwanensis]SOZ47944.1 putative permease of the Major Facilitator Superfamily (MFS) family [Cupriavidus taiwanensis]